jgi:hypothetical protein
MTSFLGVPVRVRDDVYGNLYLTDKEGATEFTDEDEALAEALALAAGIAIENTRLHDRVRVMSVLDDRDRIARDLHDRVIQRIYAVGMSLQGAARLPERDLIVERVSRAVDELDDTITQIRSTIFELGDAALPGGLRQAVVHLSDELEGTLGPSRSAIRRCRGQRRTPARGRPRPRRRARGPDERRQARGGEQLRSDARSSPTVWSSKSKTTGLASSFRWPSRVSDWSTSESEPRSLVARSSSTLAMVVVPGCSGSFRFRAPNDQTQRGPISIVSSTTSPMRSSVNG